MSPSKKIEEAINNFKDFTGHNVGYEETININNSGVGFVVGKCDGILYTAIRDGKEIRYIHEFKKKSRPLLVSNHNGAQLFLLKGRYKFTDRGIVDN